MNATTPRVSVVSAVYDVARYLDEFFESLLSQRGIPADTFEVIAVDDGSTDTSPAVLERWQHCAGLNLTVLHQENAGQGAARNRGLEQARGEWVTFTDPDDTLEPDYLAHVLGFIDEHPDVEMVATNRIFHNDETGELSDKHSLRQMFASGDRLVNLDREPDFFHGSAPAAFVKRSRLRVGGVRFDPRIRPNFEDGHFCTRYLLECPSPIVGFVASAVYRYRKRSDGSSTLQNSVGQAERFTQVPRLGYLDVIARGRQRTGAVPEWVQSFVLYELSWYFSSETVPGGAVSAAVGPVAEEFLAALTEIRAELDPDVIASFKVRWLDPVWRQILLYGLSPEPWHSPCAVMAQVDAEQGLVKVLHRFTGPEPEVEYLSGGVPVQPQHTKLRTHVYFDRTLMFERISWLPANAPLRVRLDGQRLELRRWWYGPLLTVADPLPGPPAQGPSRLRVAVTDPGRAVDAVRRRATRRLAAAPVARRKYADAWVLMDRIHDADDSGEHLFRHLRECRPEINAWFVIERGTDDWQRLRASEHRDRVVAYGSRQWELLMLNCRHLISSHIDVPVHRPPRIIALLKPGRPQWKFTFLQHGVIKDDISRWLNSKLVDLFVTSTPGEYESIAGDRNSYVFTSKEVKLTGLPRFDGLLRAARTVPPQERNWILVAPTWRHWLLPPLAVGSQRRAVREDFLDTEYAQQWLGVLRSPELGDLAREHGLRIGFLPHPNLQSILPLLDLPDHVEPLTFDGGDVQGRFARAAVLVTDYSSMAFNVAYVDRPAVYFQFDLDLVQHGGHVGKVGYFDYERDGFGPVTVTVAETLKAIRETVERGCIPAPEYATRIEETFVLRDGHCCERVIGEIEALTRPAGTDPDAAEEPVAGQDLGPLPTPAPSP